MDSPRSNGVCVSCSRRWWGHFAEVERKSERTLKGLILNYSVKRDVALNWHDIKFWLFGIFAKNISGSIIGRGR